MVWTLEGSGCEAHHLPGDSFCVFRPQTCARTHKRSLSFPSPLSHSLTHIGWCTLHSSLPGALKKAGETHKGKLKCSSECFLDMMHGSWDAAWPCCYTLQACWNAQAQHPKHWSTQHKPHYFLLQFIDLLYTNCFLDLAAKFDVLKCV